MTTTDYQGMASFTVSLTPSRVAYLIPDGDVAAFRAAIRAASIRRGGAAEPIVPVARDGSLRTWWREVIRTSDVACLVAIDIPEATREAIATTLDLPSVPIVDMNATGNPSSWTLHVNAIPRPAYDITAYGGTGEIAGIASLSGDLWEAAACGDIEDDQLAGWPPASLLFSSPVAPIRAKSADQAARFQIRRQAILDRTVDSFAETEASGFAQGMPCALFIAAPNDFDTCIAFWNVRALRSFAFDPMSIVIFPEDGPQEWSEFGRQYRESLARSLQPNPTVFIYGGGIDPSKLHDIGRGLGLVESTEETRYDGRFPKGVEISAPSPPTYKLHVDPAGNVPWRVTYPRRYGAIALVDAHVFRNDPTILSFESPLRFPLAGAAMARVDGRMVRTYPRRASVATAIRQGARWSRSGLEIPVHAQQNYRLDLKFPSRLEVVDQLLRDRVSGYQLSDKGKLANGLAARGPIQALLLAGTFEAAIQLATPRSKELVKELKKARLEGSSDIDLLELAKSWGGRSERRNKSASDLMSALGKAKVGGIEHLCEMEWAERGFAIKCPQCGTGSFVPLNATLPAAMCPGCSAKSAYESNAGEAFPGLFYRLNSLVDRAVDQGVLPHLLVLAHYRRLAVEFHLLLGTDLRFSDDSVAEVDIFGVVGSSLVVGEVKTSPQEFDQEQIARDVKLASRLGADQYLMASVAEISDSAIDFADTTAKQHGIKLTVLDPADLRP